MSATVMPPHVKTACLALGAVTAVSLACSTRIGTRTTYAPDVVRAVQRATKDAVQHATAAQQDADPLVALHNATVASTLVRTALGMMPWQDVDAATHTDILALEQIIDDAHDAAARAVDARCAH